MVCLKLWAKVVKARIGGERSAPLSPSCPPTLTERCHVPGSVLVTGEVVSNGGFR